MKQCIDNVKYLVELRLEEEPGSLTDLSRLSKKSIAYFIASLDSVCEQKSCTYTLLECRENLPHVVLSMGEGLAGLIQSMDSVEAVIEEKPRSMAFYQPVRCGF